MSIRALQDYTYYSKYARYSKEKKRRETWNEAVDRVKQMHLAKYADRIAMFPELTDDIDWAFEQVRQKRVLGSQRCLQFGGEPVLRKNARAYNCLAENTPFVTSKGVKTFADFKHGDRTTVLTHTGTWKQATVVCHGIQKLHQITINRGRNTFYVWATKNHRWLLKDGSETTALAADDQLLFAPNIFRQFVYEESPPDERLYWAYGYVYGDGTRTKDQNGEYRHSMVRLCGEDVKFLSRFEELGFESSSSLSLEGDVMAYTGKYLKTLPDLNHDSPRLIRAFVRGFLDADGAKNSNARDGIPNKSPTPYDSIQVTGQEAVDFIRRAFPVAGVYIVSEEDRTGQETNFGTRDEITIRFRVINGFGQTTASFSVDDISETMTVEQNVWCLEVEDDHSFVLPNGLVTGNCTVSYCDRIRFFQESFWLLLCGCGVGFSVQKHHIAKLPEFSPLRLAGQNGQVKRFLIPDSIEGWADALGVLLASYMPHPEFPEYEGVRVEFDYSLIRPAGSTISSGSGKAPGPEPLRRSLELIRALLRCVKAGHRRLRPIDAYDIVMHASDAVLSGGVRRSATICIFSPDDQEMVTAKTGNWFTENPQRGRSNNSALLLRDKTSKAEFKSLMKSVQEFGEPGFVWADSTEYIVNPCVTGETIVVHQGGLTTALGLVGMPFKALVDGELYEATGFWKTGEKEVLKITFESGRVLEVTPDHKLLTTSGWKEADLVGSDDEVVVNNHRPHLDRAVDAKHPFFAAGYCLGNFLADGNVSHGDTAQMKWWGDDKMLCRLDGLALLEQAGWASPQHKTVSENTSDYAVIESRRLFDYASRRGCIQNGEKVLTEQTIQGDWSYLAGLVSGYFDADGTVNYNPEKGSSIRVWSTQLENLRNLQVVLNAFGVFCKIYENRLSAGVRLMPDGKGGQGLYVCEAGHELIISCDNIEQFLSAFPVRNKSKLDKLKRIVAERKRMPNRTHFIDRVVGKVRNGVKPVYDCTVEWVHAFDANGIYVHNCVEIGFIPVDFDTGESGWHFCVAGDTKLLTQEGVVEISQAVGQEISIWNGQTWRKVSPFKTGSSRKLYRVTLSDGSYLDCTGDHVWLVKDRFEEEYNEVKTLDLAKSRYAVHTPPPTVQWEGSTKEEYAYELGFVLGDGSAGTASRTRVPRANLFKDDISLGLRCRVVGERTNENGTEFKEVSFDNLQPDFCYRMKYAPGLPCEIFSWDRNSCYDFIAGWMDADGAVAGRGFRIYGRHDKLADLQLLFTKLGFYSSLNLAAEAGEQTNLGERKTALWYVQVSDVGDLYSRRLPVVQKKRKTNGKGMWQIVKSVEELPGLHDTYCLEEPDLHQCLFNNVVTKQCNLTEQNGRKIKSKEDWKIAAQAAAILGTLQAGYTDFEYLGSVTKRIVEREALLGVSITGMMDNPEILFDPKLQREMARLVLEVNEKLAPKLGIRPTARATCVKPAGTSSCVLGTASGIHPHHARRYFRRIQGNVMEAPLQYFKKFNGHAVEKSVWSANGTDEVITFCVEVQNAKVKNDLDALTLLEHVKLTQQNWVAAGKVKERCMEPWLSHNVSNTINVRPDEWDIVADFIYDNRKHFCGISLLPISGDKDYPQAPMCAVFTPKEIVGMYGDGSLMASGLIVDGLKAFDNNLWEACDAALGLGKPIVEPQRPDSLNFKEQNDYLAAKEKYALKVDWIRRAKQFATRYFSEDVRLMTYCLKDVHNWKLWLDLQREYREVDYSQMFEERDETAPVREWACSGGACCLV